MKTFVIADTHFFHSNVLTFTKKDGSKLRPFTTVEEMHTVMIDNWNRVVGVNDKVYHIGDVGFRNASHLEILNNLNGRKVLIKGNHDRHKLSAYVKYFYDVRAYHTLDNILLAHIPIHPFSMNRWKAQIHGHLHDNVVDDSRYINVSVERIDYTPKDFEEIRAYVNQNLDNHPGYTGKR